MGAIHQGVIHEKIFNADLCTKGCPWFTQGQKQKIFKKILFCIYGQKWGVIHEGVIPEALQIFNTGTELAETRLRLFCIYSQKWRLYTGGGGVIHQTLQYFFKHEINTVCGFQTNKLVRLMFIGIVDFLDICLIFGICKRDSEKQNIDI